jgi:hypothetical protein
MEGNLPQEFSKTLIVWWRFGKEQEEDEIAVYPDEVVAAHLREKVERFRRLDEEYWRWWQVDKDLIIERPPPQGPLFGPDSRIYYLLDLGLSVIEEVHMPPPDDRWKWYIRISDFIRDEKLGCWLMKDQFCDIVVEYDDRTYHLYGLPAMAQALDVGLITTAESGAILQRIDWVVNCLAKGEFPFSQIQRGQAAAKKMGWSG